MLLVLHLLFSHLSFGTVRTSQDGTHLLQTQVLDRLLHIGQVGHHLFAGFGVQRINFTFLLQISEGFVRLGHKGLNRLIIVVQ